MLLIRQIDVEAMSLIDVCSELILILMTSFMKYIYIYIMTMTIGDNKYTLWWGLMLKKYCYMTLNNDKIHVAYDDK